MVAYTVSHLAYFKIILHAMKHPHRPVNGLLVGQPGPTGAVIIEDAIPLLHHWTSLSPMMEIGFDIARNYAQGTGLQIVGYYQACERLDDTSLAPVGEKIAEKVREGFKDAVAFVVDGDKLGTEGSALVPYLPTSAHNNVWRPATSSPTPFFGPSSQFTLASGGSPARVLSLVRESRLHEKFGDFDDHLEDVSVDWLRNGSCRDDDFSE